MMSRHMIFIVRLGFVAFVALETPEIVQIWSNVVFIVIDEGLGRAKKATATAFDTWQAAVNRFCVDWQEAHLGELFETNMAGEAVKWN